MPQIDRLLARAGRNQEMTYCECFLDGEDFSFYVKPLTMAQLVEARKSFKKGVELSDLETTIKLFTLRALNADGSRQYQADAFNVLMRLPLDDLNKLAGAMNVEEEEETDSTSKVLTRELKKETNLVAELVVAEKLSLTLSELRTKMTPEELWLWHAFLVCNMSNNRKR